ncbi:MAG: phosphate acetyltransferase [Peptoniphilaceae bacterium]
MDLIKNLKEQLTGKDVTIVFPEGEDERILEAANKLASEDAVKPLLLGKREEVEATAEKLNIVLENLDFIDPREYKDIDFLVEKLVERRKGKLDEAGARKLLLEDPNYFGTMLVYTKAVDGMVSGAVHTTGNTVRPALQIIKTKEGFKRTSGAFLLIKEDRVYIMADCAINIELDAQGLAEVAVITNQTAKQFGMDPKVAMLSFSTKGSAKHELVDKVANATKIAHELDPDMVVDGELQFDSAFVPEIAKRKAPNSKVAGYANVFIMPSIDAGNIGYKLVQRFGGYKAVGPILQGLNAPVNDLSRGCNTEEAHDLAIITAAQAVL